MPDWLSSDDIRELCPSCADKMEAKGLKSVSLDVFMAALEEDWPDLFVNVSGGLDPRRGEGMPHQLIKGLCDHVGLVDEGFFRRCMAHPFGTFEPRLAGHKEPFCAWLKKQCLGKYPSENKPPSPILSEQEVALAEDFEELVAFGGPDQATRDEYAKKGWALSDGSFPIGNCRAVEKACVRINTTTKDKTTVANHIVKNAKRLGCTDKLTDFVKQKANSQMSDAQFAANFAGIRNVAIAKPGDWDAFRGNGHITVEDLKDAVLANQDPTVGDGLIKIGHISKMNQPIEQGRPAFGYVRNLRLDESNVLRGDITSMPLKLAQLAVGSPDHPGPYRFRSPEFYRNVKAKSGKTYRMALGALALLGDTKPAIKGLDEVTDMYEEPDLAAASDELVAFTFPIDDRFFSENQGLNPNPAGSGGATIPRMELSELRELFGLKDDADEDAVKQAITDTKAKADEAEAAKTKLAEVQTQLAEAEKPAANIPDGMKLIDDTTFESLKASAAKADALAEKDRVGERNRLIVTAIKLGKFGPSRREHFQTLYDADPEGTKATIEALAEGTIPVTERGSGQSPDVAQGEPTDYPAQWLSESERAKVAEVNGSN